MNKKRLLKELPFDGLKKGTVITNGNSGFYIDRGETYYSEGGSSSNGKISFSAIENELIELIWNNAEWCEDATISHLNLKAHTDKIEITFPSLDLADAQMLAKGIVSCLAKFGTEDSNYVWKKFNGFTTSFK